MSDVQPACVVNVYVNVSDKLEQHDEGKPVSMGPQNAQHIDVLNTKLVIHDSRGFMNCFAYKFCSGFAGMSILNEL